eukprot:1815507-Prymnesium_polylepis.2
MWYKGRSSPVRLPVGYRSRVAIACHATRDPPGGTPPHSETRGRATPEAGERGTMQRYPDPSRSPTGVTVAGGRSVVRTKLDVQC